MNKYLFIIALLDQSQLHKCKYWFINPIQSYPLSQLIQRKGGGGLKYPFNFVIFKDKDLIIWI